MNFKNPSPDLQDDIDRMQEEYSDVALQQSWQKRYLPLIITGKSGTGKDTVWQAAQKILEKDFLIEFPYSHSRYLTRDMRAGEENSHLNFITKKEFEERNFASSYQFAANLYGLDFSGAKDELGMHNISIMNAYPLEVTKLMDLFFSLVPTGQLPALIITLTLHVGKYYDFLQGRGGDKEDIERRLAEASYMNIDQEWYRRLSRYKHYNYDIYRDFFNDEEKYQEHFNMNVFETVNTVLRHTQKYLAMSPEEIQQERIDFHQEHRNNRP